MKYFLTLISDFSDSEVARATAITLTPIVDSESLNYTSNENLMLVNFDSSLDIQEVHDYVFEATFGQIDSFYIGLTDSMSFHFASPVDRHLFLNTGTEMDNTVSIDMKKVKDGLEGFIDFSSVMEEDEDEEDEIRQIIQNQKKKYRIPTIDDLLDKICESGIDSLTSEEKQILTKYSK